MQCFMFYSFINRSEEDIKVGINDWQDFTSSISRPWPESLKQRNMKNVHIISITYYNGLIGFIYNKVTSLYSGRFTNSTISTSPKSSTKKWLQWYSFYLSVCLGSDKSTGSFGLNQQLKIKINEFLIKMHRNTLHNSKDGINNYHQG